MAKTIFDSSKKFFIRIYLALKIQAKKVYTKFLTKFNPILAN